MDAISAAALAHAVPATCRGRREQPQDEGAEAAEEQRQCRQQSADLPNVSCRASCR